MKVQTHTGVVEQTRRFQGSFRRILIEGHWYCVGLGSIPEQVELGWPKVGDRVEVSYKQVPLNRRHTVDWKFA